MFRLLTLKCSDRFCIHFVYYLVNTGLNSILYMILCVYDVVCILWFVILIFDLICSITNNFVKSKAFWDFLVNFVSLDLKFCFMVAALLGCTLSDVFIDAEMTQKLFNHKLVVPIHNLIVWWVSVLVSLPCITTYIVIYVII